MTTKTDKNFIYDYLIHLDSFLLHGVSEVGAPPKVPQVDKSDSMPSVSELEIYQNKSSLVAFVVATEGKQTLKNIFNSDEEQLFQKIVASMGFSPSDIYVAIASRQAEQESENVEKIKTELSQTNCHYVVCLGKEAASYFTSVAIEAYHGEEVWQTFGLLQKEIKLVIIPSIAEMLMDARHKKAAWAQLKRIVEQIKE